MPSDDSRAAATALVLTPQGAWVRIHSDRRPLDEARRWLEAAIEGGCLPDTICVVGAGLGYVVEAIAERSSSARVLVLEPEAGFIPWFLARRDWRPLIDAGRLLVLGGPDFPGAAQAWRVLGRSSTEPLRLVHPVLATARAEGARAAGAVVRRAIVDGRANEAARQRFTERYLTNTLRNLRVVASESSASELFERFTGVPIVLAAAGPSLNRNVEEIREWRDRAVIVAVDTALRPLLASGMAPDFVVAVDPAPANARHLVDLPPCPSTALVAEASIDPASFEAFAGRSFLFNVDMHEPWPWLESTGVRLGRLRAWGSVITTAFDLVVRMGGDPAILIGADLAYTDGRPYCRGTTYETDWAEAVANGWSLADFWEATIAKSAVIARALDGTPTRTANHLVAFRDWVVEASAASGVRRTINATGAGILAGGRISVEPADGKWAERLLAPLAPITRPAGFARARSRPTTHEMMDEHLLDLHLTNRERVIEVASANALVTPYARIPKRERITLTRALREQRVTDHARWREGTNLDPAWQDRARRAARWVPPGSTVLDLGAGAESLRCLLPAASKYTPADVVARSADTIVVDVNRGEFPSGAFDVVMTLGVLEYVHDVAALLKRISQSAPTCVASYCTAKSGDPAERLQRGWVNDYDLVQFIDVCRDAGWNIAGLERLHELPGFDQWLLALRRLRPPR
jgi:hypothetical protein